MNKEQVAMFIGTPAMTMVDAMEKIDKNTKGILFIVDEGEKLIGSITDGDIRRWLIKTGNLHCYAKDAMHPSPLYIFTNKIDTAEKVMNQAGISALPVVNQDKSVEDILFLTNDQKKRDLKIEGNLSNVPVVIMAGGKGTRLYPYTKILPKPLIPIGETPIVERVLNCFSMYGITKYYMTVNYKKNMIKSYFGELDSRYDIEYIEEDRPLGTGGSIKLIKEEFDRPLFIVNCDALILADYADMYQYHIDSGNEITLVSSLKNTVIPYGVLRFKENGQLTEIEEKPKLSYFINTGMYIINPEVIKRIPDHTEFHMTDLVENVMQDNSKVGIYPVSEDSFLDMGEFHEMRRMEEKLNITL